MPVRYILSSVWVRLSIFSQLSLYNIWGCVFSVNPFTLWWWREYTLCLIIIIKSEVWTIIHCLGFGHETMVCAVCISLILLISLNHANTAYLDILVISLYILHFEYYIQLYIDKKRYTYIKRPIQHKNVHVPYRFKRLLFLQHWVQFMCLETSRCILNATGIAVVRRGMNRLMYTGYWWNTRFPLGDAAVCF